MSDTEPLHPNSTSVSENHTFVVSIPILGTYAITLPRIPGEGYLKKGVDVLNTKVPTISGKPAVSEILSNYRSALSVAMVSIPLSISLGLASGGTPTAGLVASSIGGGIAAVLGGSHYSVVGATLALPAVLAPYGIKYGVSVLPIMAIIAGLIVMVFYFLRLDKYLVFVPSSVISGFMIAVAVYVTGNMLNYILGLQKLARTPEFLQNLYNTFANLDQISFFSIAFFTVSLAFLLWGSKVNPKVPWSVLLSLIGIIIGAIMQSEDSDLVQTLYSMYGKMQLSLFAPLEIPIAMEWDPIIDLLSGSFLTATICALESLSTARIGDKITRTTFNQRRELMAIAVANMVSGLSGGLPVSGGLARTILNVRSGATSRGSSILSALLIFFFMVAAFPIFEYLPLSVVAAILINTVIGMIRAADLPLLARTDRPFFLICVLTAFVAVIMDPLSGIGFGAILAAVRVLSGLAHGQAVLSVYQGPVCVLHHKFASMAPQEAKTARRILTNQLDDQDTAAIQAETERDIRRALAVGTTPLARATLEIQALNTFRKGHTTLNTSTVDVEEQILVPTHIKTFEERVRDEIAAIPDASYSEYDYTHLIGAHDSDSRMPRIAVYSITGFFPYVSANAHAERCRMLFLDRGTSIPHFDVVILDLRGVHFCDSDTVETVGTLVAELARIGKTAFLLELQPAVKKILQSAPWWGEVPVFPDVPAAITSVRNIVEDGEKQFGIGAWKKRFMVGEVLVNIPAESSSVSASVESESSAAESDVSPSKE